MTTKMTISVLLSFLLLNGCSSISIQSKSDDLYNQAERKISAIYNDQLIENTIVRNIHQSSSLKNANVNAIAYNGVVLLSGQVPNKEDKDSLYSIAEAAPNVRMVENKITVGKNNSLISRAADTLTTSKIKGTMLLAPGFPSTGIKVHTENNIVYLMGLVTQAVAEKAVLIAQDTSNVEKIVKIFEYKDSSVPKE